MLLTYPLAVGHSDTLGEDIHVSVGGVFIHSPQLHRCSHPNAPPSRPSADQIKRFKEITGSYPKKLTVVGFDFKEERFEDLHAPALRFPAEAFRYVGRHPGGRFDHAAAAEGERVSALEPYRLDPYGCAAGGKLAEKRQERDPFHRTPPYSLVCPEMSELLEYCGTELFSGDLPWSPVDADAGGAGVRERL